MTGILEEVMYFETRLYKSLNVPEQRLKDDNVFTGGQSTEITRAEIKFSKFINKLRMKFSELFIEILERQLVLKNVMPYEEWYNIKNLIKFNWVKDNPWRQQQDLMMMEQRANVTALYEPMVGTYVSRAWVAKTILKLIIAFIRRKS